MKHCYCLLFSDKPSVPLEFAATEVTEDSVSLAWQPPEDDGGSEIQQYVIEKREAGKRAWQETGTTSDLDLKVTELTDGQTYMFHVAAQNEVGVGDFAELSKAVIAKSQFGEYLDG